MPTLLKKQRVISVKENSILNSSNSDFL